MEKYSYYKDLMENYPHSNKLNSLTLATRIDGFIDACNMNLEDSEFISELSDGLVPYINKKNIEEGYNVNFVSSCNEYGKYLSILGNYKDFNFLFRIYYDKDKKKNQINNLPYRISLTREVDGYNYTFDIDCFDGYTNTLYFKKFKEKELVDEVESTCYGTDFSAIWCNVSMFTLITRQLFDTYADITREDQEKNNIPGQKEPKKENVVKKYVKKIKMMINND